MKELLENLGTWNACTESLEKAITERDSNAFSRWYAEGNRCFENLKSVIESTDRETLAPFIESIRATVERWHSLARRITPWMDEVRNEISGLGERRRTGLKIAGAYGRTEEAGKFLNVKAK